MSDSVVVVEDLCKRYGDVWGLKSASFDVERGEIVTLLGRNGAGKTTTVKILCTLLRPSGGRAEVFGLNVVSRADDIRRRISYLPQDYQGFMFNDLTPLEVISWNLVIRGDYSLGEAKRVAGEWLSMLGLEGVAHTKCGRLSGGQRRRVAVGATLSARSDLVFLDEPTAGVDVEAKHEVWKLLRKVVGGGVSVVLTTHDMVEAQTVSDRVVVFHEGKTLLEARPSDLVAKLPYRYRVVVSKPHGCSPPDHLFEEHFDLGDRLIGYTSSREEALRIAVDLQSTLRVESVSEVGLEDAYIYITRRGGLE